MKGGDTIVVKSCKCTPKAYSQFIQFIPEGYTMRTLGKSFVGQTIRKFNDKTSFFIFEYYDLRYVFTPERGYTEDSGRFCLVTVQLRDPTIGNRAKHLPK